MCIINWKSYMVYLAQFYGQVLLARSNLFQIALETIWFPIQKGVTKLTNEKCLQQKHGQLKISITYENSK